MTFGIVAGTVVSTNKSNAPQGRYLVVQECDRRGGRKESCLVALDLVGSGVGEMVIVAQGSSARQTGLTYEKPVDAVIVGIVDLVEENGAVCFRK
jgi:microcompartment protein CcmK/EutM